MKTLTTKGIKISVEVFFQPEYSKPESDQFVFSYRINILNTSSDIVQLLSRHWYIIDATGTIREVKGEGVIGKQPILEPGQNHQYISWCPLNTPVGKMHGLYTMIDKQTDELFEVRIPEFKMAANFVLN